jgi:hypothetical protein
MRLCDSKRASTKLRSKPRRQIWDERNSVHRRSTGSQREEDASMEFRSGVGMTPRGEDQNPRHADFRIHAANNRLKLALERGTCDAGGGTRTPDTRIMIPLL